MPYGDQSGPAGMGPMTGRGVGFCAGYGQPGYMAPLPGRGAFGRGPGGGRGFRNRYWATGVTGSQQAYTGYPAAYAVPPAYAVPAPGQELDALRDQVKFMEENVKKAQERIQELEQQAEDK